MGKRAGNPIAQQAEAEAPIKPSEAARDERGRVNLDDLADVDLDYGLDERGLASLRCRLMHAIAAYNGAAMYTLLFCLQVPQRCLCLPQVSNLTIQDL